MLHVAIRLHVNGWNYEVAKACLVQEAASVAKASHTREQLQAIT